MFLSSKSPFQPHWDSEITQIGGITMSKTIPQTVEPTTDELKRDFGYHIAQQILNNILNAGFISRDEYVKITQLNRASFSPYLVDILPNIT